MNKQLKLLLLFAGLSIALRFLTFFPSVINHDESTYIVIADALLAGDTYFVDYIDTKPIGVFLLIAGFQLLLGKSIFVLRLVTALWLALTAFLLYKIMREWNASERAGIAAGVIYLFLNSIFTFYGVSPNTETYFNLFTVLSLWLILRRRGGWEYFLAGLSLGLGFLVKYVIAFDGLAFGLLILIEQLRSRQSFLPFLGRALLLAIGFFLPFGLLYGYYHQIGASETFWFHSFMVAGRYPHSTTLFRYLKFPLDFFGRFLPVTIFYFMVFFRRQTTPDLKLFGALWSVCVLAVVLIPGNFFGHYFIHFMLPFSFMAAWIFNEPREQLPKWLQWLFRPKVGYSLLGLLFATNLFLQKKDYIDKPDYPRIVAKYLEERLEKDDGIYVGNYSQIIYHLLDRRSPVKYVHPSLFWKPEHIYALEFDVEEEVKKLQEAAPRFVLLRDEPDDHRLDEWLAREYRVIKVFEKKNIYVYERIN